jgi:hypothetical protein
MNMTGHARAGLTSAHETVQTLLLIIITFVGTWLSLYRVPLASIWRPMSRRRRCYGRRRHLPVANALAGIARSDF